MSLIRRAPPPEFGHVPGTRLVFTALAVVVSITGMWPVFRWVIARLPRQPVRLRRVMHAAWFGAIGFEILKQAFTIYLRQCHRQPHRQVRPKKSPGARTARTMVGQRIGQHCRVFRAGLLTDRRYTVVAWVSLVISRSGSDNCDCCSGRISRTTTAGSDGSPR
jgi:hypothetical protein